LRINFLTEQQSTQDNDFQLITIKALIFLLLKWDEQHRKDTSELLDFTSGR